MPFELPVEVSGFGGAMPSVSNGTRTLQFSTADILRSAVVAGYATGTTGVDLRIRTWRLASIRLALNVPATLPPSFVGRFSHPRAWKSLDPSERASINNLLGNVLTKLLCERLLDAPRLWFLDVFWDRFTVVLAGVKRPDFFTLTRNGKWLSVEAKGRSYGPSAAKLCTAKDQAEALTSVNGVATSAHVVCWTMERQGSISARFHDPAPGETEDGALHVEFEELVRHYYAPVHEIIQTAEPVVVAPNLTLHRFVAGDFLIGFHPAALEYLRTPRPEVHAKLLHLGANAFEPVGDVHSGPDGIIVVPGRSWPTN